MYDIIIGIYEIHNEIRQNDVLIYLTKDSVLIFSNLIVYLLIHLTFFQRRLHKMSRYQFSSYDITCNVRTTLFQFQTFLNYILKWTGYTSHILRCNTHYSFSIIEFHSNINKYIRKKLIGYLPDLMNFVLHKFLWGP